MAFNDREQRILNVDFDVGPHHFKGLTYTRLRSIILEMRDRIRNGRDVLKMSEAETRTLRERVVVLSQEAEQLQSARDALSSKYATVQQEHDDLKRANKRLQLQLMRIDRQMGFELVRTNYE